MASPTRPRPAAPPVSISELIKSAERVADRAQAVVDAAHRQAVDHYEKAAAELAQKG